MCILFYVYLYRKVHHRVNSIKYQLSQGPFYLHSILLVLAIVIVVIRAIKMVKWYAHVDNELGTMDNDDYADFIIYAKMELWFHSLNVFCR